MVVRALKVSIYFYSSIHRGWCTTCGRLLRYVCDCGCWQLVRDHNAVPVQETPPFPHQFDDLSFGSGGFNCSLFHDTLRGECRVTAELIYILRVQAVTCLFAELGRRFASCLQTLRTAHFRARFNLGFTTGFVE